MSKNKVDLTLIKKLMTELETSLDEAEKRKTEGGDPTQYIIEISKCAGLSMSISNEASALIGDMFKAAVPGPKEDAMSKLLGALSPFKPGTN